MPQLCKDCRYIKGWPGIFHECRHPENIKQSLISGADATRHSIETCRDPAGHCCTEGAHFVPLVEWHDDKPNERADMHVSTMPGDLDSVGRPLRPGS